jgi:hypothetical protein
MVETSINLVLCIVILALGIWAYVKKKWDVPFYIGIAFGLFGVSHALKIAGLADSLATLLVAVRVIGYLLVVVALCRILMKK